MEIKEFIKTHKTFFALWSVLMLINFALWAMHGSKKQKSFFYPFEGSDYGYKIGPAWDLPEVLIYGIGPLLLFIIYQTVIKEKITNRKA